MGFTEDMRVLGMDDPWMREEIDGVGVEIGGVLLDRREI